MEGLNEVLLYFRVLFMYFFLDVLLIFQRVVQMNLRSLFSLFKSSLLLH